jgi:hypothetical protein
MMTTLAVVLVLLLSVALACLFRVIPGWHPYYRVRSSQHVYQRIGRLPIFRVRRRKRDQDTPS